MPLKSGIRTKLVYEDLASTPADRKRYEILDGDLHVTTSPPMSHQRAVGNLFIALDDYFTPPAEVFFARFDVILSKHDVVEPDLIVVKDQSQVAEHGVLGPPLVVVEVLSEETAHFDRTVKAPFYAKHAIPHYWIVDPDARRVECFKLEGATYQLSVACAGAETLVHPDFPGLSLAGLWG
jgi:Uma2 family endonuclease